jgi:tetratricopeptide (TPR) repeat protein
VRFRPAVVAVLVALAAPAATGCAHRATHDAKVPAPPPRIGNLDTFETTLNRYALLGSDDPARELYRERMLDFLVRHAGDAIDRGDEEEAESALRYALSLFSPQDLTSVGPQPQLANLAHRVYGDASRRGDEVPSLLALAVEQRFAPTQQRERAVAKWKELEEWLVRGGPFSDEPMLRHDQLERALEEVAAGFPSPFVVQRLADLYVARYEAAVRARSHGREAGTASLKRIEITGYLLMRLYLRADDPDGAIEALGRVELDMPVAKLREVLQDAMRPRRSARALLSLAEQFVPEPGSDPSLSYVQQGWAIVDNLSRRALERHPKDAYVHLMRARTLDREGLLEASIVHLRQTIDLKEDVFEAWEQLARQEYAHLSRLSERNPKAADQRLGELEQFHRRAVKLWRDRPLSPGLPAAYYVVAEGMYQGGHVQRAQQLLTKSLDIEPNASTLDLLGTIALKRRQFPAARSRYEALGDLAFDGELTQLQWEARARQQLGEIARQEGDDIASSKYFREALRFTNELLARLVSPGARADRLVERGKLLFWLGDVELAMEDFEDAIGLAPASPKSFADPLLQLVAHGYYDEAMQIFRRARGQGELSDSLKVYFALWMHELALQQGRTPDPDVMDTLAEYRGGGWAGRLARHARGTVSFDDLLAAASDDGERAEARFYEGLKQWRGGAAADGKRLMQQVLDSDMMGFFEYDLALLYLQAGAIPTQAQPVLAHHDK